ncbi:Cytochrome P450 2J2 [Folsomia candida]|uniref:Cytochrome P450 2J2 n=1 Tax=Folsomia candida TaxID=158441 RepID=A0A226DYU3_FOLCA|nr:Cytochrome P450 2J2 [Folsomia candida]
MWRSEVYGSYEVDVNTYNIFLLYNYSQGTLTSHGDSWSTIRNFTVKNLSSLGFGKKCMEPFILPDIEELVDSLSKEVGNRVDFKDKFYTPVTNHLWNILTGEEIRDKKFFRETLTSLHRSLWQPIGNSIWFLPWLTELFPGLTGLNWIKNDPSLLHNEVKRQTKNNASDSSLNENLVKIFLKEIQKTEGDEGSHFHKNKGDNHMKGTIINFYFTAAEAMTNTLNWALLYLSLYPETQEKLADEILAVIGSERSPSLEDLINMPYTKAVMQEVLRISSTSPFSNFQMTTQDVTFETYFIPKNTIILANLYGIHHDPNSYPEPEIFNPDRFLDETRSRDAPPPFLPFSVGLRSCPGQTFARNVFFLLLVSLCQKFEFRWDPNVEKPSSDFLTEKCNVSFLRFTPKFKLVLGWREKFGSIRRMSAAA